MVILSRLAPLQHDVKLVYTEEDAGKVPGSPTPYFIQMLTVLMQEKEETDGLAEGAVTQEQLAALVLDDLFDVTDAGAHGAILYRDSVDWQALAAGAAGKVLTTNGAGADPSWETPSSGGALPEATLTKPLAANFTLENPGAGATLATKADGTNGLVLTVPTTTVNARFLRYTAGLPGSSWTLTMRGQPITPDNGVLHTRAIIMRNSTSGRLISFADSSATTIGANRWSSYTAHNAAIFSYGAARADMPWRRVVCNGTTLTFQTSVDGHDWQTIGTEAVATYLNAAGGTLDQVGIGMIIGAAPGFTSGHLFQSFTLA